MISKELLDILVCPADKKEILLEGEFLRCTFCGRRYPVRDGIPVMLIEEGDKYRIAEPGPAGAAG
ncbi:MAG: Trm112 family protein [Chloroflexota bacterium]